MEDGRCVVQRGGLRLWVTDDEIEAGGDARCIGDRLAVRMPAGLPAYSPGFYTARGDRGFAAEGPLLLDRLYLDLRPEGAVPFVREATRRLNRAGLAFVAKVVDDPRGFDRRDAAVLAVERRDRVRALAIADELRAPLAPLLDHGAPAMTLPLAPGLAFAEDPGGGESFGAHRCLLLAEAAVTAAERGLGAAGERLEVVASASPRRAPRWMPRTSGRRRGAGWARPIRSTGRAGHDAHPPRAGGRGPAGVPAGGDGDRRGASSGSSRHVGPIWEVNATIDAFASLEHVPPGYWPILVSDSLPGVEDVGMHLDQDGQPFALVEVSPSWSLTASHEVIEMVTDPWGNRVVPGGSPKQEQGLVNILVEICDPVGDAGCAYTVNGYLVSDFVTPNYYDPVPAAGVRYSFTGAVDGPRLVQEGGYLPWRRSGHWRVVAVRPGPAEPAHVPAPGAARRGRPAYPRAGQHAHADDAALHGERGDPALQHAYERRASTRAASLARAAAIRRKMAELGLG